MWSFSALRWWHGGRSRRPARTRQGGAFEKRTLLVFLGDDGDGERFLLEYFAARFAAPVFGNDVADLQAEQPEDGQAGKQLPVIRGEIDRAAAQAIDCQRNAADHDAGCGAENYPAPVPLHKAGKYRAF